jgi:hypothetical protein
VRIISTSTIGGSRWVCRGSFGSLVGLFVSCASASADHEVERLAGVERRLAAIEARLGPTSPAPHASAIASSKPSQAPAPSAAPVAEEFIERVFASEARDDGWASRHERLLLNALRKMSPNILVRAVTCHTTICKITLTLTSNTVSLQSAYSDALRGTRINNTAVLLRGPRAAGETVIYQTRQGYGFPLADGSPHRLGAAGAPATP